MTTRADIEAARARLLIAGEALRMRPREQTLNSLVDVVDSWREPGSRWQRRLVDELPDATGFSAENVREGLALGLASWTGDALREVVERELGGLGPKTRVTGFPQTRVLLAGSIPMPTLLSLLAPLALESPVLAKTASRDPLTAGIFRESLAEIDPLLASALEVVSFASGDTDGSDAFLDAECIVATGSDETVASIAQRARAGTRLVSYGHRVSIAVLGHEATGGPHADATAYAVARDIALWDQLGCLSPIAVFCVGDDAPAIAEDFAHGLAEALAAREKRTPLGELPAPVAAAIRAERDGAEMRRSGGADVSVHGDEAMRFSVIREADTQLRPAPLHRFIRIHALSDREALGQAIAPLTRHLAGVALAGFGAEQEDLANELARSGASRICAPGALQTPPLGWHHDNQPIVLPLARVADFEARVG